MTEHLCTLRVATDGSHNYINPTVHDIGNTGKFCVAAIRTGLGVSNQLVLEESVSSPFRADLVSLAVAD